MYSTVGNMVTQALVHCTHLYAHCAFVHPTQMDIV